MKIVGSVRPDEVPTAGPARFGLWTNLALKAIEAHEQGEVLVLMATSRDEYKHMVNGMAEKLRNAGYTRSFTTVDEPDGGVRVYCQLIERPGRVPSVVVKPIGRPRRRANA